MTFEYGSPGFDAVNCPPCPEDGVCHAVCVGPVDGPLLALGLITGGLLLVHFARLQTGDEAGGKEVTERE